MSEKEKTLAGAGTPTRAGRLAACGTAAKSKSQHTTQAVVRQVADVLPIGAENAISARTLAEVLGLKGIRAVSRLIELERRAGVPICAATGGEGRGYFLPSSPGELEDYLKQLNHRISQIRRTWGACENTLRRMSGQEVLEGWNV